jgi:hypothetical protein
MDGKPQDLIETWFQSWFYNSPGISDNSWVYARLRAAVDNLKARFDEPIKEGDDNASI